MAIPTGPIDVRLIADLSSPDWWNIGLTAASTVLGAIIGAGIAYLVARQSATENRNAIKAMQRASEEAATLRAETKLIQIMNGVAGYHQAMEHCIEEARAEMGENLALWSAVKPFAGRPMEILFDADDVIAFIRAREFEFVSKFILLFSRFNAMELGLEAYKKERDKLLSMLTPERMRGLFGTVLLTEEEARRLAPHVASVDDLARQAVEQVNENYNLALDITKQFGPIVRRYFCDPAFPIPAVAASSSSDAGNH